MKLFYTKEQGPKNFTCSTCKYANHNTHDRDEGLTFCAFGTGIKGKEHTCDMRCNGDWVYSKYNGKNCMWGQVGVFSIEMD